MQELWSSVSFSLPIFLSLLCCFYKKKNHCAPNAAFLNITHLFPALLVCYKASSRFILKPHFKHLEYLPCGGRAQSSWSLHRQLRSGKILLAAIWILKTRPGSRRSNSLQFTTESECFIFPGMLKTIWILELHGGFEMWKQLAQGKKLDF